MLQSLHIHNFALIEDLHLTFGDGVTIFTGETGAGKSILLDAIGMLAGKRASASFVRHGTDSFLVEGAFFFSALPEGLEQLLEANHIEVDEGQLIISRQFPRSGRGTILVNGTLVPTATLRRLGEYLLDIHGQFDNSLISTRLITWLSSTALRQTSVRPVRTTTDYTASGMRRKGKSRLCAMTKVKRRGCSVSWRFRSRKSREPP